MKSLSKSDEKNRQAKVDALAEAREFLAAKIAEANAAIAEANSAAATYNEALEAARGFAEDIAREIESYIDDRSDNWRDGDRGSQYAEWLSAWQNFAPDDLEVFADLEEPSEDHGEELSDLAPTPDEF